MSTRPSTPCAAFAIALVAVFSSAASAAAPATEDAYALGVRAELIYKVTDDDPTYGAVGPMRIVIHRRGKLALSQSVPKAAPQQEGSPNYPRNPTRMFSGKTVGVVDLEGDREPEVLTAFNWNGTHCCLWTRVYWYDRAAGRYRINARFWGDFSAAPELKDIKSDGKVEFVGRDGAFIGKFTGTYADSVSPLQVWRFEKGRFLDVTRDLPLLLKRDSTTLRQRVLGGGFDVRGAAASWAAEQALLGNEGGAHRQMLEWSHQGRFNGDPNFYSDLVPIGDRYVDTLWQFLEEHHYFG